MSAGIQSKVIMYVLVSVLMIRIENCQDIFSYCKFIDFPIDKFVWFGRSNAIVGQKCLITNHYHKL